MITFTKFKNTQGLLSKSACLEDGKLVRSGGTQLYQGTYETIQIPFSKLGDFLPTLTTDSAMCLGVSKHANTGTITSKNRGGAGITRTKDNFVWPESKLLVFDFDGGSWATMEEGIDAVVAVCPCLAGKGFWLYPSSSSYLEWEGGNTGLKGFHAYFQWNGDLEQLQKELRFRFRAAGMETYLISNGLNPSILTRYPIDFTVFSAERLLYSAGSACGDGVHQARPLPQYIEDDGVWDESFADDELCSAMEIAAQGARVEFGIANGLKERRDAAREDRAKLCKVTGAVVERQEKYLSAGQIPGSLQILMDDGTWVACWRFLIDSAEWNKKTCHDPFEPDYDGGAPNKAIIYAEGDGVGSGSAHIVSHAHGTHSYSVVWDQASILEALQVVTEVELESKLGTGWMASLYTQPSIDDVERTGLLEPLKKKLSVGKEIPVKISEVKAKIAAGTSAVYKGRTNDALEAYNEQYATVEINGCFRVLKERMNESGFPYYEDQKDDDFKKATAGDKLLTWDGAKPKMVSTSKMWLEWDGRRHYNQMVFDPSHSESEWWTGGEEGVGERVLNQFRGFVCQPAVGRGCGAERGCFECFFGHCGKEVCAEDVKAGGGVTYWLRHIYEVVCHSNEEHARWVIDWISDAIRNPGGPRPDTALIVYGEAKGTGKGATIWPAMALLNGAAMEVSDTELIVGRFNSCLERTVLMYANEATWGKGQSVASKAKNIVDGKMLNIERKGIEVYKAKNHLRVYASSNNEKAWPVEVDERRAACFEIGEQKKRAREWFGRFFNRHDLLPVFLDEMRNSNLGSALTTIPETTALGAQKAITTRNRVEVAWLDQALEGNLYWDKDGIGVQIGMPLIRAAYEADKMMSSMNHDHGGRLTSKTFLTRLRIVVEQLGGVLGRSKEAKWLQFPPRNEFERRFRATFGE